MGEAFIVRRGGSGGKFRKMEVTFDKATIINDTNVLTLDVGFRPFFLFMESKDPSAIDNNAATRFSISFTPDWSKNSNSVEFGSWWWCRVNTSQSQKNTGVVTHGFKSTETGIVSTFEGSYTYAPIFHGTYTVTAYG